ncbi:MAG: GNAT family N-acetyltransferase [Flavobacteriaceae bacterium]|nr:GNAT family N-acetyltransferase [Flavobacteriaceae bacterium]NNJ81291.1 GNAT family N-acetyltransferase [Flavobacteriaceae bacterium]NNK54515.1 GNAT family N-acetyltransferase [Flavobacteriaceae bacterium]NNM08013.1 GNAT family N-acetyltransferase [Flavobacteriaceae bacterium]
MRLKLTNSDDKDFIELVESLDRELAVRDGDDHAFYHQFNAIDMINNAIVAYEDKVSVGCGAIKEFDGLSMEVKRMYTLPDYRGKGIASKIVLRLELWAKELGYPFCVLETGKQQPEAMALYKKQGYEIIPNYGQYAGVTNSICFKKKLI